MGTIQIEIPEGKKAEWINGVLTLVDDNLPGFKFKVGDPVLLKAMEQVCIVEEVIRNLSTPAYKVSGWDGIFNECAFAPIPQDITERIKTFKDACEWCNENGFQKLVDALTPTIQSTCDVDIVAYFKLRIITCALNEGWVPTEEDTRYVPYYNAGRHGGLELSSGYCGDSSSKLCFKSQELAVYAAVQFYDIYTDFSGCGKDITE